MGTPAGSQASGDPTAECSIPETVARVLGSEQSTRSDDVSDVPLYLSIEAPRAQDPGRRSAGALGAEGDESGVAPRAGTAESQDQYRLREIADLSQPRRYQQGEVLGRGGMGVVHRVVDKVLGRESAMKVIDGPLATRPLEVLRFLEEAQITAQLDHPGIVPVHDFGIRADGDHAYFTMKLVRGDTLSQLIAVHRTFGLQGRPMERLLGIFVRICEAIAFAHSRRVLHRDLKPDNVLVGSHGQVYVMDWGLARVMAGRPSEGSAGASQPSPKQRTIAGTPAFMAPEQARGDVERIGPHSDIFGLGAILYAILTGHGPFHAASSEQSIQRAQRGELVGAEHGFDDAPPELVRIAMKALAHEPEDRYGTAEELARDVEAFLRGGGWFATRRFAAGETIIEEGEPGSAAYVLTEGRCEVYKSVDGARIKLRTLEPGDVFGETAVFTAKPRSATVVAIEPTTVKVVTRDSLERELDRSPWMGAFVRAVAERFREVDEKLSTKL